MIVRLMGGLGNQLFQYAAGRRLAYLHQTSLKLDITSFETDTRGREYSLSHFCIQQVFATAEEIAKITGISKKGLARKASRLGQKLKPYYRRSIFSEPHLKPFDPNILKTPKDVYLNGYWQSEKYFVGIQEIIRREFTIRFEQDPQSRQIAEKAANTQSVSIHVRRDDNVWNPASIRTHGTCSLDYYNKCVSLIAEKVANPHFFVFSDDSPWVLKNLRLDYPSTYVTHNYMIRDYEDLRLMSLCKHHIIANSSFSWWAAWLNPNPDKIVLYPRKWFNEANFDTRDLFPEGWIMI